MRTSLPVLQPTTARVPAGRRWGITVAAALTAVGLLATVQLTSPRPVLLAERFLSGAGWLEIAALSLYAGWLAGKLADVDRSAVWRRRMWTVFSFVFFAQLVLGLLVDRHFLMTGSLHLPVPAMIVAGPIYRGAGLFMPIVFVVSLLLVGPAWCSYLCYLGSWDLQAAGARPRPRLLPRWRHGARLVVLTALVTGALALRLLHAPAAVAAAAGLGFGVAGVAIMLLLSRRAGAMVHCLVWCPIGLLATGIGRLSPFRIRLAAGCDGCNVCRLDCRYDALRPEDVARRRPGLSCTLCGDCLRSCAHSSVELRFPGLSPRSAHALFVTLVTALHAVFMGVARI